MRMIHWGVSEQTAEDGRPLTCHCHILARDVPPPMNGESYGIRLTIAETEEMMEFMDLTVSGKRILDLAEDRQKEHIMEIRNAKGKNGPRKIGFLHPDGTIR